MAGRFQLFPSAEILSENMRIVRNTTIRPPKRLLAGAPNNTQLFLCFKISRGFITRKIGVPAQGWKAPRTYYARRQKIQQIQYNVGVHWEFKCHLGFIPMLLKLFCRTEVTDRRGKCTHGFTPERPNHWFGFHSDQTRVPSMDIKSERRLG